MGRARAVRVGERGRAHFPIDLGSEQPSRRLITGGLSGAGVIKDRPLMPAKW